MCGRTACTLAPDDIVRACSFRNRQGKRRKPAWKDPPGGQQYYPCYNIAPTAHTPVLLSSRHFPGESCCGERVVQPMKWGLVPAWHQGNPYKLGYETNNCRAEGMLAKRTYKTPLEKGNRCVVLADGFFEWKKSGDKKQPYFIYFPQKSPDVAQDSKPDLKGQVKQEQTDIKPDPTKLGLGSSVSPQIKQEANDVKPGAANLDLKSSANFQVKQEPVDVKPDPGRLDWKPSTNVRVKQEQRDSTGGPAKLDCKSFVSPDIKQEPVEIKSDPDAFPDVCSMEKSCTEQDSAALKNVERNGQNKGQCGDSAKAADQDEEDEEWQGKHLLTMAGVFDVWKPQDGSPPLYSYSVITVEASPSMAGIHHRMPAILSTEEEVRAWLDFAEVPLTEAVKVIHPTEAITMHMVSPVVNNSSNKSPQCVQVYDPKEVKKTGSSMLMMNWLKKASSSSSSSSSSSIADAAQPSPKKQKLA